MFLFCFFVWISSSSCCTFNLRLGLSSNNDRSQHVNLCVWTDGQHAWQHNVLCPPLFMAFSGKHFACDCIQKYCFFCIVLDFLKFPKSRLPHNPFASIVNSFSTGYGLSKVEFPILRVVFSCTCAVNTRIIITYYKQTARVIILKSTQNKTNHFEWLWKVCMAFVIQNYSKFMRLFIMISRQTSYFL